MRANARAWDSRRLRRGTAALFGRLVAGVAKRLSEPRALAFGAGAGRLAWWLVPRRRRQARANLRVAFPEQSEAWRESVARASFEELGRSLAEWGRLVQLSPEELRRRVCFEGIEHVERAVAAGRGAFFATAHYGNWELLPAAWRASVPQIELVVVGREFGDTDLQRRVERRRLLGGGQLLRQDAREILRALRRGAAVGVLVDLYTPERRGGILVPFFGRRTWTTAGPATLAIRTGAPILPVHIHRLEGSRHRAVFGPPLELPASGDRPRDILELTARMSAAIEGVIRTDPVPWLWIHRRWKRSVDP